jgi:2,3-bisphosphoglycerate-dependent phosphoglycerate mutase
LNKAETAEKFGAEQVQLWRRSFDATPPGGESLKDTRDRVVPYYQARIEPLLRDGKRVLVVGHGNSLRALVMVLDNLSPQAVVDLNIPTGAPLRYVFDSNGQIIQRGYLETHGGTE